MASDQRPWGSYRILHAEPGTQVKRIEIKPGLRFSLQKHAKRSEKWVVVSGQGTVTVGDRQMPVAVGTMIDVPVGEVHRMHNTGREPLVFIEVQLGSYLGEDDIVRLSDDFGRE